METLLSTDWFVLLLIVLQSISKGMGLTGICPNIKDMHLHTNWVQTLVFINSYNAYGQCSVNGKQNMIYSGIRIPFINNSVVMSGGYSGNKSPRVQAN